MNIQRFTAPTSRKAMAKARNAFGDSAVILSTRSTEEGFEVMAAAEESLAQVEPTAPDHPRSSRSRATSDRKALPQEEPDSVESDTQQMAMSTLSFQEYVRERMLRKRRASLNADTVAAEPSELAAEPRIAPEQIQVPMQRFNAPLVNPMPAPIRTRPVVQSSWQDSLPPQHTGGHSDASSVAVELSALKEMIEERFNTLAWLGSSKQNPIHSNLMLKLIRAGFSPAMSRAVLERVRTDSGESEAMRRVMDVLTRNLKTTPGGASLSDEGGVVALIGATGVGKTTTAAKLAAQCIKQYGTDSVGLITLDTYRVAGFEQLRAYGRMLGVVAHLAHDRAALQDLLTLLEGKRMVIIDTAGLGQRDQRIQDMLDVLDLPKVKKCLVLNAGAHGDTLDDVLTSFKASSLYGVILSKTDEAVKYGPALDALLRHQVVLRGVANGQRVPEDWQNPDAAALVRVAMSTDGKSVYDPLSSDMGFYFAQASSRGIDLGASHV